MIRIEIDSEDETPTSTTRMVVARQSLEQLGEKVTLTYTERFTPMQRTILFTIFISGMAFGALLTLIVCNRIG